ncbi:MAG: glucose-6-phosphate isomerase [Comamonas sp. SCN 67-35]|uniref:glucose-6-phosphate isomerase n=1 Tax=unclassified Comamonas TaxID=2638500 RepID=UPI00086CFB5F|nr:MULTISPECIES: glucose-6-phosphate isomerase [unclassified Comamonas]MBN9329692.1 glucose-6-phosphate isomerase [Comamonas sp.]ODU38139.1 MAG: glucose-6-phosphate isomerase [Comamonas sp. SCN 67-35]OJX03635.1 MAG: glucose-6-phosphate isomerase [Burkholderiales bacterium 66-26]
MPLCHETSAWARLQAHWRQEVRAIDLAAQFERDGARLTTLSQRAPHLRVDLSKNWLLPGTPALLQQLARECGVMAWRDAMFAGEAVNTTERRAAMHWLLRTPPDGGRLMGSAPQQRWDASVREALREVGETLQAMLSLAEQVRSDDSITDVVHIGIGGSYLGPEVVVQALQGLARGGKRIHFVANVDGAEIVSVLRTLRMETTLFLVASKSFTTAETMMNAHAARDWFLAQGGSEDVAHLHSIARHFVALTAQPEAAARFGITRTLGFRDWVGGRYSLWSAIGLPVAIAVGAQAFRELLAGAHEMDAHFLAAAPEANLPLRLGLLDVWYRDFCGLSSRCIAPYSHGLRRLPAYLQQLEMESNGKGVTREGRPLHVPTAPVIWGEPGTNGQHAFFQMLHQGQDVVPVEFIAVRESGGSLPGHHHDLVVNAVAQARALMAGSSASEPHRRCPGNRPSTFVLLDRLDPAALGALIALYEHRVFVSGAVWGVNSFDQWGVELGKCLARDLFERERSGNWDGVDPSTRALMAQLGV